MRSSGTIDISLAPAPIGSRIPALVTSANREMSSASTGSSPTPRATTNSRQPGAGCSSPVTRSNGTANGSAPATSWLDTSVSSTATASETVGHQKKKGDDLSTVALFVQISDFRIQI